MLSWSSLHADLLRLCFSYLDSSDVLRTARVCKAWSKVASSDQLWIIPLSTRFQVAQHVLMEEYLQVLDFGALQLKDIFLIACPPQKPPSGKERIHLHWFVGCQFHPKRHTSVTAMNIIRLARCYWSSPRAFWSMSGVAPHGVVFELYRHARSSHRSRRFGDSLDRLVRFTYWLLVGIVFLAHAAATYALALHPSVSSSWHWARPGILALNAIPFGALAALSAPHLPWAFKLLVSWAAFTYACRHSWPQIIYEAPRERLALGALAAGAYWVITAPPPQPHRVIMSQSYKATAMLIAAAVLAWRITIPTVAYSAAYFFVKNHSRRLCTGGYIDDT